MTDNVKRGNIFDVAEGLHTGSEQHGKRPAIIVSNDTGNTHATVVEVVYLTTQRKPHLPTHVYINSSQRPSTALCEQIFTVCKSRLKHYAGKITPAEMSRIDKALTTSLGIEKVGGKAMQLTMTTPFGEMNFEMAEDKVSDLMQRAFQYASGKKLEETPRSSPPVAQEAAKAPQPTKQPHRRVDTLFGDFKAARTSPAKEPEELTGYKGFLLVKCKHCGKVKGFMQTTPLAKALWRGSYCGTYLTLQTAWKKTSNTSISTK